MLSIILVGLNHRTAEVGTRERAAFQTSKVPDALRVMVGRPGIREAIIFSTCNRVELLAGAESVAEGQASMEMFLCESSQVSREQLEHKLYRYTESHAVRHVFRVASSLDSMILGEPQILGQVKSFYNVAVSAGTVGTYLNSLLQAAFHAAKRVRTETNIGDDAVSVSSAAVELARKVFGQLRNASILIVGAGKMGELTVRHLAANGVRSLRVANRSIEAARELASKFQGEVAPYENLAHWISLSDVVITSTGSEEILVDHDLAQSLMAKRKNRPMLFIDISVPRNVDSRVATLDNVFCYDIDDLGVVVQANLQERQKEAVVAEKIIEQEVDAFCARLRTLDMTPIVVQLQNRINEICQTELQRFLRKAGALAAEDKQELELMVSRIANKIAHPLITQMRSDYPDAQHQSAYLDTIKRIFKLHKNSEG